MTREGAYLAFLAMRWSIWIPLDRKRCHAPAP